MTLPVLSARQVGHARTIIAVCIDLVPDPALARLAAVYATACSLAEASLTNWENGGTSTHVGKAEGRQLTERERDVARLSRGLGDGVPPWGDNLDSMGLFAQRPMSGWGHPRELMRPTISTTRFLTGPAGRTGLLGRKDWATAPFEKVIASVQGYYDPKIYSDARALAEDTVTRLWPTATPITTPTDKDDTMPDLKEVQAAANAAAQPVPAAAAHAVWSHGLHPGYSAGDQLASIAPALAEIAAMCRAILKGADRPVGICGLQGRGIVEVDIVERTIRGYPSMAHFEQRMADLTAAEVEIVHFPEIRGAGDEPATDEEIEAGIKLHGWTWVA